MNSPEVITNVSDLGTVSLALPQYIEEISLNLAEGEQAAFPGIATFVARNVLAQYGDSQSYAVFSNMVANELARMALANPDHRDLIKGAMEAYQFAFDEEEDYDRLQNRVTFARNFLINMKYFLDQKVGYLTQADQEWVESKKPKMTEMVKCLSFFERHIMGQDLLESVENPQELKWKNPQLEQAKGQCQGAIETFNDICRKLSPDSGQTA